MKKITVLGAGMVGCAIAIDLSKRFLIKSCDINPENLKGLENKKNITTQVCDISNNEELSKVIADADLVIGAVPGYMGYKMLEQVIRNKKNIVDISFFPENSLALNQLALDNNVTAIVDCGVAPGMDNILYGFHYHRMQAEEFVCMVGGLPMERKLPFQYKAPFSPIDVLEEYTRPARLIEHGEIVTKPALSEPVFYDFERIGTLEAFNTDGLRSLLFTMPIKNMKEITLRYPGHRALMESLSAMGFFNSEPINIKGQSIKPIDVTAKLFFPEWKYKQGEKEFTVMRVIIKGKENGKDICYTYDLYDEYDDANQTSSMARTTGFTCAAAATMVLENIFNKKGIIVPEYIGEKEEHYNFMINYLKERNIHYKLSIS